MYFVNETFEEYAEFFTGEVEADEEMAHAAILDRSALDYSLESLKSVDKYLQHLFDRRPEHMGRDWVNTILWGGAYVGEVIRRNSDRRYEWVDFDDWLEEHPEQAEVLGTEKALQVCAFLTPGGGSFTLPLNKVFEFIANGPEDSTWFYAAGELRAGL